MELMSMLCWLMVLPAVGLVSAQYVLDGVAAVPKKHAYMNGAVDKVLTYIVVNYPSFIKTKVGHYMTHLIIAVVAGVSQMGK